jgi:hypothetical protein
VGHGGSLGDHGLHTGQWWLRVLVRGELDDVVDAELAGDLVDRFAGGIGRDSIEIWSKPQHRGKPFSRTGGGEFYGAAPVYRSGATNDPFPGWKVASYGEGSHGR